MRTGRKDLALTQLETGENASALLAVWGMKLDVDEDYVRWLETSPAFPLSSPHRLSAVLSVYSLNWRQVLETIGVRVEMKSAIATDLIEP